MMQAEQHQAVSPARLEIRAATVEDVRTAFRAGLRDITRHPALSLFFGLVYALFGGILVSGLLIFDQVWIMIAVGVGFPLVAPFLAAGLYEMSRRLKRAEPFTASDIFLVIFSQRRREFGWMALAVLFVFWMWAYQVRLLLALFLQQQAARSLENFVSVVFTTTEGALFLAVGTLVGSVLATILFSITVIAMPLLMDKEIDFVTAMITSVRTVHKSPAVMLGWGAVIGALSLVAVAPAFLGVIVVFPILGHATWHLYERLISET
ncbi:MAG: DUF2189 domain-containing protein [Magnetovibrio sp.]|nr:DUF2189 domain-containing protein [Magnetovibrio sp.]